VTADPITQAPPARSLGTRRRSPVRKALIVIGVAAFVTFWTWALFFASKTAVNKIEDRAWAERAETICADYDLQLVALEAKASPDLQVRADLVVESTDLLAAMLDEVMAVTPTDDKGRAIVPAWEADYRTSRTATATPSVCVPARTSRSRRPPSRECRSPNGSRPSLRTTRWRAAARLAVRSSDQSSDLITRAGTPTATL
jgi:hypothetical protein